MLCFVDTGDVDAEYGVWDVTMTESCRVGKEYRDQERGECEWDGESISLKPL